MMPLANEVVSGGISDFLSNAVSAFGTVWSAMTANPAIGVFIGLGLLGAGARVFKRFRKSV